MEAESEERQRRKEFDFAEESTDWELRRGTPSNRKSGGGGMAASNRATTGGGARLRRIDGSEERNKRREDGHVSLT